MRTIVLSLLFGCMALPALWAQSDQPGRIFSMGGRLHSGFIIPHSKDIVNVSGSNPYGLELQAVWLMTDEWHVRRSGMVSKRGVSLHLFDFDNRGVLGQGVSVTPFVQPVFWPHRRFRASLQTGLGFVWLNRVYDAETNPTNLFFSFPLSMLAMVNLYGEYAVTPHWEVSAGFNYNHISNGGMKQPNKGMNFPTFNVGAAYTWRPQAIQRPPRDGAWRQEPRHYGYLQAAASVKNTPVTDAHPDIKPCLLLGGAAVFGSRIGRLSALAAGAEWIHDGFQREMLDREGLDLSAWKVSLLFGHELLVGRVRFASHLGAYLYSPAPNIDPVYHRHGLHYRFGRRLWIGGSLKAHRHIADVFDLRASWMIF